MNKIYAAHYHVTTRWDEAEGVSKWDGSLYCNMTSDAIDAVVQEFDRCYNQTISGCLGFYARHDLADSACKAFVSRYSHCAETDRVPIQTQTWKQHLQSTQHASVITKKHENYLYRFITPYETSMACEQGWQKEWGFRIHPWDDDKLLEIHATVRTWILPQYVNSV